eukprot:1254257-Karenia_brevis.AAC.1
MLEAKRILCIAMTGTAVCPTYRSAPALGILPFVECLAFEINDIEKEWCRRNQPLYEYFSNQHRPHPGKTLFSYLNSEKEHEILSFIVSACADRNLILVLPIFDG